MTTIHATTSTEPAPPPCSPLRAASSAGGARVRFPPPLVFLSALLGGIALHFAVALAIHTARPALLTLGIAVAAVGVATVASARTWFFRTRQNPAPWTPTPELILRGPYRFTRNPMYVGITTFLVGLGVATNVLWITLLAPVALAIVHVIAVRPEEQYLTEKFGDNYTAYRARVRRYI
jgi:protein-S-isoprenylcysteine O-methyltransferase Ste14